MQPLVGASSFVHRWHLLAVFSPGRRARSSLESFFEPTNLTHMASTPGPIMFQRFLFWKPSPQHLAFSMTGFGARHKHFGLQHFHKSLPLLFLRYYRFLSFTKRAEILISQLNKEENHLQGELLQHQLNLNTLEGQPESAARALVVREGQASHSL